MRPGQSIPETAAARSATVGSACGSGVSVAIVACNAARSAGRSAAGAAAHAAARSAGEIAPAAILSRYQGPRHRHRDAGGPGEPCGRLSERLPGLAEEGIDRDVRGERPQRRDRPRRLVGRRLHRLGEGERFVEYVRHLVRLRFDQVRPRVDQPPISRSNTALT